MSLTTDLVHYWKLDESSGDAADTVGSFTFPNVNTVTYSAGKINNGANLAMASSQCFLTSSTTALNGGTALTAYTLSIWIYRTSLPPTSGTGQAGRFFQNGGNAGEFLIGYKNVSGTYSFYVEHYDNGSNKIAIDYTVTLSTSTWYHVALTWNGTTLTLYLNGASVGTPQSTSSINTAGGYGCAMGQNTAGTANTYWDGSLDEVGFWKRGLSSTEVGQLYNGGNGLAYPLTVTETDTSKFFQLF